MFFCFFDTHSKFYYILTFILFLIFSIIIRTSGYDLDIRGYAVSMKINSMDIYYLKEPVYWLTSRYVYSILKSEEATFVFYDVISFVLVLLTTKKLNLPSYYPYLFLLFFPCIMGMENVYRQYLSMVLSCLFLTYCMLNENNFKIILVGLFAGLTHNVFFLFISIFLLFNKKKGVSLTFVLTSIGFLGAIQLVLSTKSYSDTGELGAGVYLVMSIVLFLFYCISYQFKFDELSKKILYLQVYFISLLTVSMSLMGSAQSKRVGMFCLVLMLVPIVIAIEKNYKENKLIRFAFYIFAISPTFIFSSSRNMLLTAL
ncbi:EpsG family protein [Enterobacter hormaechei]|uniref:EpsG family protein n=1 Tax=Enterobacter hormaechei TaxID=158836 RepID=UPI003CC72E8C